MTSTQERQRNNNHKTRQLAKKGKAERERNNNKVFALIKFFVLLFSFIISYFVCNDFVNLSMNYFVTSLTIGSDMLIILLSKGKSQRQFKISICVWIYSLLVMIIFFLGCTKLVTYVPILHILKIGQDLSFIINWWPLKSIYMIGIFILICTYSLEHTEVLTMPDYFRGEG